MLNTMTQMEYKKIVIVTDAWIPQVNGVVQTLTQVIDQLNKKGNIIEVIHPAQFNTIPCPSYPEIRLALFSRQKILKRIESFRPDHIHIATEGPLGISTWRICSRKKWCFTTAFHTQFPEYINQRYGIPLAWTYALMRKFHNKSSGTMVATSSVAENLRARGLLKIRMWCRGVDTQVFKPFEEQTCDFERPIHLYVGRVAIEKSIEDFLSLPLKGSKVVVGDGPDLKRLQKLFPATHFLGVLKGESLARQFSGADVFVFPSKTDTFGLVMLEAMACGTPVAAYPVQGPLDVLTNPKAGIMDENLALAIERALQLKSEDAESFAHQFSWEQCAMRFKDYLVDVQVLSSKSQELCIRNLQGVFQ